MSSTSEESPLDRLDEAVRVFLNETGEAGQFVTGWALGISTARIQADDDTALPMVTGARYSFGPQTSVIQLAGLAKYLEVVAEKATWEQLSEPDD